MNRLAIGARVIQDCMGNCYRGFQFNLDSRFVLEAELYGIWLGLNLVHKKRMKKIISEMDSKVGIHLVK